MKLTLKTAFIYVNERRLVSSNWFTTYSKYKISQYFRAAQTITLVKYSLDLYFAYLLIMTSIISCNNQRVPYRLAQLFL